jgi:hypothetical protein
MAVFTVLRLPGGEVNGIFFVEVYFTFPTADLA